MFTLDQVRTRLALHSPDFAEPGDNTRQAAVAIILRETRDGADMLFIKRSEKVGDPWSGHMAFPGGHLDAIDPGLREAAMRETLEEIGLDLAPADYLGALDHQQAAPRGRRLDMIIAPHVFQIEGDPRFTPNHEVAEVVWTCMPTLASNVLHDTETKPMNGVPTVFNGYRLEGGHFVWGLTYRMLKTFFSTLDAAWDPPPEID